MRCGSKYVAHMFPPIHCCPPPSASTPRDPRRARERRRGQGRRRAMQGARSRCTCPAPALLLSCPMTSPPVTIVLWGAGGGRNPLKTTTSSGSLTGVSNFLINPRIFQQTVSLTSVGYSCSFVSRDHPSLLHYCLHTSSLSNE